MPTPLGWPAIRICALFFAICSRTASRTSVLAIASLNIGWAILTTAGLSFLGVGVQPPTAEWGQMIATGTEDLVTGVWWISIPGVALFVVLGCNLLGDGLQRMIDRRRGELSADSGSRLNGFVDEIRSL